MAWCRVVDCSCATGLPLQHNVIPHGSRRTIAARALLEIFHSCETDQQDLIVDDTDASAVWAKFDSFYEAHNAPTVQRLFNEFANLQKRPSEPIMQFIARAKSYAKPLSLEF